MSPRLTLCSRCLRVFPPEEIVYRTGKCRPCLREYDRERGKRRRKTAARGYDARWRKLAAAAVKAQPFCSTCGASEDLTLGRFTARYSAGLRREESNRE